MRYVHIVTLLGLSLVCWTGCGEANEPGGSSEGSEVSSDISSDAGPRAALEDTSEGRTEGGEKDTEAPRADTEAPERSEDAESADDSGDVASEGPEVEPTDAAAQEEDTSASGDPDDAALDGGSDDAQTPEMSDVPDSEPATDTEGDAASSPGDISVDDASVDDALWSEDTSDDTGDDTIDDTMAQGDSASSPLCDPEGTWVLETTTAALPGEGCQPDGSPAQGANTKTFIVTQNPDGSLTGVVPELSEPIPEVTVTQLPELPCSFVFTLAVSIYFPSLGGEEPSTVYLTYEYAVDLADGGVHGSGTVHSATIFESGEVQQECTEAITVGGGFTPLGG